jgi:hypothetical protein
MEEKMTKDEALKMAIEVLDLDVDCVSESKWINAFNACKEALEQPFTRDWKETIDERIARDSEFKEALEQPAQDYVLICKKCGDELGLEYVPDEQQKPYAYAYVREDGVGLLCWTKRDASLFKDLLEGRKEVPLYADEALVNQISDSITLSATAGQFKKWQGLTDDEIGMVYCGFNHAPASDIRFARAIEAKLKEKNHETT